MKIKVKCRHGVEYSVMARGNKGECLRLQKMLSDCCCYVCYNRHCETPRKGKQECKSECEIYGRKYCELIKED